MRFKQSLYTITVLFTLTSQAIASETQTKPIKISKELLNRISKLEASSSNANEVERILGKPAACLPLVFPSESWVCQWKGNLSSAGIANTLNIQFEAGIITSIIGIDKNHQQIAHK